MRASPVYREDGTVRRSLISLAVLNFFLADARDGLGPFLDAFLATRGWSSVALGAIATTGGLIGLVVTPLFGALVDGSRRKRTLVAGPVIVVTAVALLTLIAPTGPIVWVGQVGTAVVGAVIQLGNCFDLLDTRFTKDLTESIGSFRSFLKAAGAPMPTNKGPTPDRKLRRLDCAVLNWYLDAVETRLGVRYDTVRGCFREGGPVFRGSGIFRESHIQIAVRNPASILGVFRPLV